jgi:hypothetical protein
MTASRGARIAIVTAAALLAGVSLLPTAMPSSKDGSVSASTESAAASALDPRGAVTADDVTKELASAAIRLPLAAALGAALALRPRRRGTPPRRPPVVQTQIVLAIVGATIMLVVGASLARAFGIVGVASLVRYRSKIDDPKDAGVMLGALAVGLASGVGLYALAVASTVFLALVLMVIESLEPRERVFGVTVKLGKETASLRPKVEAILRRVEADYELRGVSEEEVTYQVTVPSGMNTDRVSRMLTALAPDGKGGVEWSEGAKGKGKAK